MRFYAMLRRSKERAVELGERAVALAHELDDLESERHLLKELGRLYLVHKETHRAAEVYERLLAATGEVRGTVPRGRIAPPPNSMYRRFASSD
ncbi:hypothetical protein [Sorangium sp. So ce1335]|uniref:hypothetical protein n=1 Tax=Sorangium sp. So ce1335 TaxID=3133335 RepID=UPI003F6490E4